MACDRFHFRHRFLHFNGKSNSSCCHQVCLFTDMKICRKLYYPKKQLSVGKSLVLFKCQLHFRQYIKTKRVFFRIKLYQLSSSNGTTLNFSVNSRKRMFLNGDENSDKLAPERMPFYQIFFSLTGTPDIPPFSGNNDAVKRFSSVRYFS